MLTMNVNVFNYISGTFPIDTTKTRLQIQGQKLDGRFSVVRYNGMFHALSRITREEGVRALYSGYASKNITFLCFDWNFF